MFLPCTSAEIKVLGWEAPDIILVSGDAYIDSPFSGVAVIGRTLTAAGFKVAMIAQPDVTTHADIQRLGAPKLFWGVSGGCVDSMVANYTATGRKRREDDFTPGGVNDARPDRAVIAYCNLIRAAFKPCALIVIGGIEASLRRIAHYDFWSDRVRRPLLFDAKADILVYGMAERTMIELSQAVRSGSDWRTLRALCYALPANSVALPHDALTLPDYSEVAANTPEGRKAFLEMYRLFAAQQEPQCAKTLLQRVDTRVLVHNPPQFPLTATELDAVYELPYMLEAHPVHAHRGKVRALDTIRFSLTTHRGCYGECNFCAIAVHQGRQVVSRCEESILREAQRLIKHPKFRGIIQDVGGPTANMYGFECERKVLFGACADKRCICPQVCPALRPNHARQTRLLKKLRGLPGVHKIFVASGIRPDLISADADHGGAYMEELVRYHVSGQLKLAPEHIVPEVLAAMGKPGSETLLGLVERFFEISQRHGIKQFLTYYFIAAHPGCGDNEMRALKRFVTRHLKLIPEQVQVFTPTPSTWSTAMYYTGINPVDGKAIMVTRKARDKQRQKEILTGQSAPRKSSYD